jgi:hypothetical protein
MRLLKAKPLWGVCDGFASQPKSFSVVFHYLTKGGLLVRKTVHKVVFSSFGMLFISLQQAIRAMRRIMKSFTMAISSTWP